jgi:hypothetical protein
MPRKAVPPNSGPIARGRPLAWWDFFPITCENFPTSRPAR